MSQSAYLLVAVGHSDLPRRMIMLCDTGATHSILSKRVVTKLRHHGVALASVPKSLERLRSVNDSAFTLSEAVQHCITIGAYTYRVDFHVADGGIVDMIISYPQMRLYNRKLDLGNHALDIRVTTWFPGV